MQNCLSRSVLEIGTLACCWDVKQPTNKHHQKSASRGLYMFSQPLLSPSISSLPPPSPPPPPLPPALLLSPSSTEEGVRVCLLVACLTSQQHASVSQGRICSDNLTCCHTETEVADQTFYQSQYTDTGPTSPRADPITPGA